MLQRRWPVCHAFMRKVSIAQPLELTPMFTGALMDCKPDILGRQTLPSQASIVKYGNQDHCTVRSGLETMECSGHLHALSSDAFLAGVDVAECSFRNTEKLPTFRQLRVAWHLLQSLKAEQCRRSTQSQRSR